jgi:UDP-N-acetylglucosamine acyltransferase
LALLSLIRKKSNPLEFMTNIHKLAVVEEGAQIGEGVTVEPFAVVKKDVVLKDNVTIMSHAYIDGFTTIGEGTTVFPGASIGTRTQDLKYVGEQTFVEIGAGCTIREFATINSSCGEGSVVRVGENTLIMAYCHVAHNCEIGKGVVMANGAMLAGHVIIEDFANIGGMTPIHQKVRVGAYAFVGGFSRVTHDIPPYTVGAGSPYKVGGLNLVGLRRRNFSFETRQALTKAFKLTYRSDMRGKEALEKISEEIKGFPEVEKWVSFCQGSERGLTGLETVVQA